MDVVKLLKAGIVLLLLVGVAVFAVPRLLLGGPRPQVDLVGDLEDKPVVAEVPYNYLTVRSRLMSVFNPDPTVAGLNLPNRFEKESKWYAFHLVSNKNGQGADALFRQMKEGSPSKESPLGLGYREPEQVDAALEPYLSQPAENRQLDFFLTITPFQSPEYWWASLYQYEGNPVPYRSHYILALTPTGKDSTRIEVIAVDSEVEAGEEYSYRGSEGARLFPSKMPARMLVKPVVKDKTETLETVVQALVPPKSKTKAK